MAFQHRTAERKQAKMRVGITSPSGGGKTYSALLLGRGLASAWDKVWLVDTESGSGELYSHMGPYQVVPFDPPYTPERYIEALDYCEAHGAEVVILDSATHEWDGVGGCLEISDKLTAASRTKNSYTEGWAKVTPRHQKFLARLIAAKCHIVTTTRRKQDYDMSKDSNGRTVVTKVGLKEVQRDGFEYELTLNFELDMGHNATAAKDRTGQWDGKPPFVITEETGRALKAWCESGAPMVEPTPEAQPSAPTNGNGHFRTVKAVEEKTVEGVTFHLITFDNDERAGTRDAAIAELAQRAIAEGLRVDVSTERTSRGGRKIIEFALLPDEDEAF
jgi:hypothetical protein